MKKVFSYLIAVAIIIITLIGTVNYVCFDRNFYSYEFKKLNISASSSIAFDDLVNSMDVLLDYLRGDRNDMIVYGTVDNEYREIFNQREKDHMVDVRDLYHNTNRVMITAAITSAVILAISLFKHYEDILSAIYHAYRNVLLILMIILASIGLLCWLDFNSFWTQFHLLFFRNDLWLLNPKTDLLIRMVPEAFFLDLVSVIAIIFALINIIIFVVLNYIRRRTVRQL